MPWITFGAFDHLHRVMKPNCRVFEWGAGASTVYFALRGCRVFTVESDAGWVNRVSKRLEQYKRREQVTILHTPKGMVGGVPNFTEYASAINSIGSKFDLIMVDGLPNSRNLCLEHCLAKIAPTGIVVLDNSDVKDDGVLRYTKGMELLGKIGMEPHRFAGPGRKRPWDPNQGNKKWETTIWHRPKARMS